MESIIDVSNLEYIDKTPNGAPMYLDKEKDILVLNYGNTKQKVFFERRENEDKNVPYSFLKCRYIGYENYPTSYIAEVH